MACEEYPQLEVSPYLDKLDYMADMAQESLRAGLTDQSVEKINTILFETLDSQKHPATFWQNKRIFTSTAEGYPIYRGIVYHLLSG